MAHKSLQIGEGCRLIHLFLKPVLRQTRSVCLSLNSELWILVLVLVVVLVLGNPDVSQSE